MPKSPSTSKSLSPLKKSKRPHKSPRRLEDDCDHVDDRDNADHTTNTVATVVDESSYTPKKTRQARRCLRCVEFGATDEQVTACQGRSAGRMACQYFQEDGTPLLLPAEDVQDVQMKDHDDDSVTIGEGGEAQGEAQDEAQGEGQKSMSKATNNRNSGNKKTSSSSSLVVVLQQQQQQQEEHLQDLRGLDPLVDGKSRDKNATSPATKDDALTVKPQKVPATLDVHVHRLRHFQYMPSAITTICANVQNGYVAVARADGSIELNVVGTIKEEDYKYQQQHQQQYHYLPHLQPIAKVAGVEVFLSNSQKNVPLPLAAECMAWVPTTTTGHGGQSTGTGVLVAASPTGTLWAVDFERARNCSPIQSGGGAIFDMQTCAGCDSDTVQKTNTLLPLVATACQDGTVRVWRVEKGNHTTPPRIVDPPVVALPVAGGAPILSLAWRCQSVTVTTTSGTCTKNTLFQTVLFAAVADGTIRKYKLDLMRENTSLLDRDNDSNNQDDMENDDYDTTVRYSAQNHASVLRMTVESKGRQVATRVWTMQALSDGTLVAGNSLGQVQFWNSCTGTLQQTIFQTNQTADVLTVAVNPSETKVFCSGVDSRVVCIERLGTGLEGTEWKLASVQRPHSHDVKALAIVAAPIATDVGKHNMSNDDDRVLETLLSGGVDTKLCSYETEAFAAKRPHIWFPWPADSPISNTFSNDDTAPRFMAFLRSHGVELFQFENRVLETDGNAEATLLHPKESRKDRVQTFPYSTSLGTIQVKAGDSSVKGKARSTITRLQASRLSQDGKWLAVSNAVSTFIYHLAMVESDDGGGQVLRPTKVRPTKTLPPATTLQYWDNFLFVADANHRKLHMVALEENAKEHENMISASVVSKLEPKSKNSRKHTLLPIQDIQVSRNGNFVATMSRQEGSHAISIFHRIEDDNGKAYEHYWDLPSLGSHQRPAAMTMIGDSQLAVATFHAHLYIFDLIGKKLSPWSEQNGFPVQANRWTEDLLCRRDFPLRLLVDPSKENQLIMVGR